MDSTTFVKYNDEDEMPDRAIPYYWKDGEVHKYNPKLMKCVTKRGTIFKINYKSLRCISNLNVLGESQ